MFATGAFACQLCEGTHGRLLSRRDAKSDAELMVYLCEACGLVQQSPLPSTEELRSYYARGYRMDYKRVYQPPLKHIHRAGIAARHRIGWIPRPRGHATLLDLGAGGGEFVYLAGKAGYAACGVEPDESYSRFARDNYGVDIRTAEIEEAAGGPFDIVTMFHVMEHLRDPLRIADKLFALLKPGGLLLIEVPNIEQADASPGNIFFKAHLNYFSKDTLSACMSRGFEPVRAENTGNLSVLFRRRPAAGALVLPTAESVEALRQRLRRKGWIEYLFLGGGLVKPLRKLARSIREKFLRDVPPRELLDKLSA